MAGGNWQLKLQRFMMGRNGPDDLSRACVWFTIAAVVISFVTGFFNSTVSAVFSWMGTAFIVYGCFRMFSRNIVRRNAENRSWVAASSRIVFPARRKYTHLREWMKYHKTHRVFTCATCGQSLRVPKGKGSLRVTCPKCKHSFEVTT